jgi:hypothetical protein
VLGRRQEIYFIRSAAFLPGVNESHSQAGAAHEECLPDLTFQLPAESDPRGYIFRPHDGGSFHRLWSDRYVEGREEVTSPLAQIRTAVDATVGNMADSLFVTAIQSIPTRWIFIGNIETLSMCFASVIGTRPSRNCKVTLSPTRRTDGSRVISRDVKTILVHLSP